MGKNLFKLCFVVALLASAVSISYAGTTNLTGSTVLGGGTFSPSNKVNINANSTSVNYAAEAKHSSGDRIMGTNNTDPKMYWTTSSVGATATSPSGATTSYSSWTSL